LRRRLFAKGPEQEETKGEEDVVKTEDRGISDRTRSTYQ
jgi:hypothetical protein